MRALLRVVFCGLLLVVFAPSPMFAKANPSVPAAWTTPFPPFRIVSNVYYVGSKDLAAYLIKTPEGLILINSNLSTSVPQLKQSVEKLGFHFNDIKILLV